MMNSDFEQKMKRRQFLWLCVILAGPLLLLLLFYLGFRAMRPASNPDTPPPPAITERLGTPTN